MQFIEYCTEIGVLQSMGSQRVGYYWVTELNWTESEASQMVLMVKNWLANAGNIADSGSIPGSGRCPGGGHGRQLHYSCLRISWTEGPTGLQSIGLQRVRHDCSDWAHIHRKGKTEWSYEYRMNVSGLVAYHHDLRASQELRSLLLPRITREYYTTSC